MFIMYCRCLDAQWDNLSDLPAARPSECYQAQPRIFKGAIRIAGAFIGAGYNDLMQKDKNDNRKRDSLR